MFIYNQIQDKYLTFEDGKRRVRRFRGSKMEWGFDKLVTFYGLTNPKKGYWVNDCCVFGADFFVVNPNKTRKNESAYLVKVLGCNTCNWNIPNFDKLKEHYKSGVFTIGGYKWSLEVYPNRDPHYVGILSAYLYLEESEALDPGDKLNVEFVLRVRINSSENIMNISISKVEV